MFLSFWYLAFRCLLQLVLLRPRSTEFKELEIVVLRHQLACGVRYVGCVNSGPSSENRRICRHDRVCVTPQGFEPARLGGWLASEPMTVGFTVVLLGEPTGDLILCVNGPK